MRHLREIGLCSAGARDWFSRHGFDWPAFLELGIDAEQLEATGDHYALTVCEHARGRQG